MLSILLCLYYYYIMCVSLSLSRVLDEELYVSGRKLLLVLSHVDNTLHGIFPPFTKSFFLLIFIFINLVNIWSRRTLYGAGKCVALSLQIQTWFVYRCRDSWLGNLISLDNQNWFLKLASALTMKKFLYSSHSQNCDYRHLISAINSTTLITKIAIQLS